MTVLITAGPTREPLDPVRYLTNRSSGKMGYAIAGAFARRGHHVLLISGPTQIDVPDGVDFLPVETADDMARAVEHHLPRMQIGVFVAAVSDYRPAHPASQKIKKGPDSLTLELVKNPDILGMARDTFGFRGTLVGFAAETENLEANAREKLHRKACDLIVANDVSQPGLGFESDRNRVHLIYPDRTETLDEDDKAQLAPAIVEAIEKLSNA